MHIAMHILYYSILSIVAILILYYYKTKNELMDNISLGLNQRVLDIVISHRRVFNLEKYIIAYCIIYKRNNNIEKLRSNLYNIVQYYDMTYKKSPDLEKYIDIVSDILDHDKRL